MADDDNDQRQQNNSSVDEFMESLRQLLPQGQQTQITDINHALFRDNFRLREDRRTLRSQLTEAQQRTAVPDGAALLQGDELTQFRAFQSLGLTPDQISEILVAHDNLSTQVTAGEAAEALGWKTSVLKDLIESKGLVISKDDKGVPVVIHENDKGEEVATPLADYTPLKEYHPALQASSGGAGGRTPTGVRVPAQIGTGGAPTNAGQPSAVVNAQLASRYQRPSALKQSGGKK